MVWMINFWINWDRQGIFPRLIIAMENFENTFQNVADVAHINKFIGKLALGNGMERGLVRARFSRGWETFQLSKLDQLSGNIFEKFRVTSR